MDLVSQILQQAPVSSTQFDELRRLLNQIDRENSRKKSIYGLIRLSQKATPEMRPYISSGIAMAYFLDHDFAHSLFYLKDVTSKHVLSPMAMYAATMIVTIYRMLGMKKERFEAEGSRLLIMKKIAMQSNDPNHRILALNELKKELEERELHDEAQKCDLELNYWQSFLKKKKSGTSKSVANHSR